MDIRTLPNPYDFANPVTDADLFAGRTSELEDIIYYLDQASTAARPINVALLGERASGKTSMLNMIQVEAEKRGFCVARINLDESHVATQLTFLYTLFDAVFTESCRLGAFGGITGQTYDVYLDMTCSFTEPADKLFCPCIFPIQYQKAAAAGRYNLPISDTTYRHDLSTLKAEISRPIIVLFDESDVLSNQRALLQKMRNLFMNTPGYMIVLAGTPELFPVMDDVFSPIVRQFKKISIGRFAASEETESCIKRPLEKAGFTLSDMFGPHYSMPIKEIHELSSGKPYEVQLICHYLFRRLQAHQASRMTLSADVLEDIRRELYNSRAGSDDTMISAIRHLGPRQLQALGVLCGSDGKATFDQIWSKEYILHGDDAWTKPLLETDLQELVRAGVVARQDEVIKFRGDEFDKIYLKYYAREQGVFISVLDFPLDISFNVDFDLLVPDQAHVKRLFDPAFGRPARDFLTAVQSLNSLGVDRQEVSERQMSRVTADIYRIMLKYQGYADISALNISLTTSWTRFHDIYVSEKIGDVAAIVAFAELLCPMVLRAKEIGDDMTCDVLTVPVIPEALLFQRLMASDDEYLKRRIATVYAELMVVSYVEKRLVEPAGLFHSLSSTAGWPRPGAT